MVESEAAELSEDVMLGAVMFGHQQMQMAINAINELVAEAGTKPWDWTGAGPQRGAGRRAQGSRRQPAGRGVPGARQAAAPRRHLRDQEGRDAGRWPVAPRPSGLERRRDVEGIRRARIPDHARLGAGAPRSASTAARWTPCARSPPRSACCRACTAPRCSPVARPRRSSPSPWAPRVTARSSTPSPASTRNTSCSTTTSPRTRWVKPAA